MKYTILSMAMSIIPWGHFGAMLQSPLAAFIGLIIQVLGLVLMFVISFSGKWTEV